MKKIKEQQSQESHSHDHGKMPVVLYFIGLALALTALFLNDEYSLLKNILLLMQAKHLLVTNRQI